jgi:hypothetical protein
MKRTEESILYIIFKTKNFIRLLDVHKLWNSIILFIYWMPASSEIEEIYSFNGCPQGLKLKNFIRLLDAPKLWNWRILFVYWVPTSPEKFTSQIYTCYVCLLMEEIRQEEGATDAICKILVCVFSIFPCTLSILFRCLPIARFIIAFISPRFYIRASKCFRHSLSQSFPERTKVKITGLIAYIAKICRRRR